ncbi:hypothetical protein BDA99DRAFT_571289 [Phascolomyces articulosus]|uniref:Uncharacterized protein n=1 Tax=Phascolomyces articulosus TaxID=60185 RepID=A0AAD5KBK3_9FUNG|nr:hypothetical protein BDA99DRAFT_571289 [Phascolomyces articulosus]
MAYPWTEAEINALVKTKQAYPHSSWDRIAQKIGSKHTPDACRRKYSSYAPKLATPWSLPQRRQLAKMVYYEPPTTWEAIGERVGHTSEECEAFYNNHVSFKELARGKREAQAEQRRLQFRPSSIIIVSGKQGTTTKRTSTSTSNTAVQQEKGKSIDETSATAAEGTSSVTATEPTRTTTIPTVTVPAGAKRRLWTEEEVDTLIQMRGEGHGWNDIAIRVNRTPGACQSKWRRLY